VEEGVPIGMDDASAVVASVLLGLLIGLMWLLS